MSDLTISSSRVPISSPNQAPTPKVAASKVTPTVSSVVASSVSILNVSEPEVAKSGANIASIKGDAQARGPVSTGTSGASNILTFRDNDTGRLIIKLIDKDNNAVIAQFPSLTQLGNYPKINYGPPQVSTIDKEI